MSKKISEIKLRTRYGESDQMGVIHHGSYVQYIEMGRIEWLRELGISYRWMEENGILLPVISMCFQFKKSAKYDDILRVKTILRKRPSVKIEFDYEIYDDASDVIITTANTVLAFVNPETNRPMQCPDFLLEKLGDIS